MKRRTFLKSVGAFVAGCYLAVRVENPFKEDDYTLVGTETGRISCTYEQLQQIVDKFSWDSDTGTLYFQNETPNS